MKEFKYTIFFSLLLQVCFAQNSLKNKQNSSNDTLSYEKGHPTIKELEYLKVRDSYIKHFKSIVIKDDNDKIDTQESDSLKDLEKRLRDILKDCRINNIAIDGEINLETLLAGLGFRMLDGLNVTKDSIRIFCTSKSLFFDYFKKEKISQPDNLTTEDLENIFNSVFYSDARITNFSSGKIPAKNNIQVYGMVGMVAQDIGLFLPEFVYVFIADDNFIYMAEKHLNKPVKQIPKCKSIWDSINLESQKALQIYDDSQLQDTASFNKHVYLDELAFDKYCGCFQRELKKEIQYKEIQKQIEKIVQYIISSK
jgi:hypothetical protein